MAMTIKEMLAAGLITPEQAKLMEVYGITDPAMLHHYNNNKAPLLDDKKPTLIIDDKVGKKPIENVAVNAQVSSDLKPTIESSAPLVGSEKSQNNPTFSSLSSTNQAQSTFSFNASQFTTNFTENVKANLTFDNKSFSSAFSGAINSAKNYASDLFESGKASFSRALSVFTKSIPLIGEEINGRKSGSGVSKGFMDAFVNTDDGKYCARFIVKAVNDFSIAAIGHKILANTDSALNLASFYKESGCLNSPKDLKSIQAGQTVLCIRAGGAHALLTTGSKHEGERAFVQIVNPNYGGGKTTADDRWREVKKLSDGSYMIEGIVNKDGSPMKIIGFGDNQRLIEKTQLARTTIKSEKHFDSLASTKYDLEKMPDLSSAKSRSLNLT
jgi:hypothetical protein